MPEKKEYPRINLTVDAVVFGYKAGEGLSVLLIQRKKAPFEGKWAIPGGFVEQDEPLEKAVLRELEEETSVKLTYLEQLYTFGDPKRDPRGRTVSVAYYGLVKTSDYLIHAQDDAKDVRWYNILDLPQLAFDHKNILEKAIQRLRGKIGYEPVGFDLLDKHFPFSDLRVLYETLYGKQIDPRNFRKKFMALGILTELKTKSKAFGRPAALFTFDKAKYFALKKRGMVFEI